MAGGAKPYAALALSFFLGIRPIALAALAVDASSVTKARSRPGAQNMRQQPYVRNHVTQAGGQADAKSSEKVKIYMQGDSDRTPLTVENEGLLLLATWLMFSGRLAAVVSHSFVG